MKTETYLNGPQSGFFPLDWLLTAVLIITGVAFVRPLLTTAFMTLYEYFVQGKTLW